MSTVDIAGITVGYGAAPVLHGLDLDPAAVRKDLRAKGVTNVEVIAADKELTLGACLNLGVDASDGKYVAKVDDDNFYGRHYLTDLLDCFTHSGAGIVGKWAHYTWLRSSGAVVLRFPYAEHRFEKLVQGGTIILDRDVVTDLRFGDLPRAVATVTATPARAARLTTRSRPAAAPRAGCPRRPPAAGTGSASSRAGTR